MLTRRKSQLRKRNRRSLRIESLQSRQLMAANVTDFSSSLDTSFQGDGFVDFNFGTSESKAVSSVIQEDGKIVVVGESDGAFGIARFHSNGAPDQSFGTNGEVRVFINGPAGARDVAIDDQGKIIVAGYAGGDFGVVRLNTNGTLDTRFDGDGRATINFSGSDEVATKILVQGDRILVSGGGGDDFAIARLDHSGKLDPTFGNSGAQRINFGGGDVALDAAFQSDGSIVLVGAASNTNYRADRNGFQIIGGSSDIGLVRLSADGVLDTRFGSSGKYQHSVSGHDFATSVAIGVNDEIYVGGKGGVFGHLSRLKSDGRIDTAFGSNGHVRLSEIETAWDLVLADNQIVVAGVKASDITVTRLSDAGRLDVQYGAAGTARVSGGSSEAGHGLAIDSTGRYLVVGEYGNQAVLTRFLGPQHHSVIVENRELVIRSTDPSKSMSASVGLTHSGQLVVQVNGRTQYENASRVSKIRLVGSNHNDQLYNGTHLPSVIEGRGGDDELQGGSGRDVILGGSGDDTLHSGFGYGDQLDGGAGKDQFVVFGEGAKVSLESNEYQLMPSVAFGDPDSLNIRLDGSTLEINGVDQQENDIRIDSEGDTILVYASDNLVASYAASEITSIEAVGGWRDDKLENLTPIASRLSGGPGQDTLVGGSGADFLHGMDGNDRLFGGRGNDVLFGGNGNDFIDAGDGDDKGFGQGEGTDDAGQDTIYGGLGDDLLAGGNGADQIWGGEGHDEILGEGGADRLDGGNGNDTLLGGEGADHLEGGKGNDLLNGGEQADVLKGQDGEDALYGENGRDVLYGGNDHDRLYGGYDNDILHGGAARDWLFGEGHDDKLFGDSGNDYLKGGWGHDRLEGGDGNDHLYGEDNNDHLIGGTGDDFLDGGRHVDVLEGQDGEDVLRGGDGRDVLYGGNDHDRLYGGYDNDILHGGGARDWLFGEGHNDKLYGDSGNDYLNGGWGHDRLEGGDGNDHLYGEDNNDHLIGGTGDDFLDGGEHVDVLEGQQGKDVLYGRGGDDVLDGGSEHDRLYAGSGNDTLRGGSARDWLFGEAGNDKLYGDSGNDYLKGGSGDDVIDGGSGNDHLYGESGSDRLVGGQGYDLLNGGSGADKLDRHWDWEYQYWTRNLPANQRFNEARFYV